MNASTPLSILSIFASEPLSPTQGILMIVAIFVVAIVVIAAGAYVFIRLVAHLLNSRRDAWQGVADDLKLKMNSSGGFLLKGMSGKRGDRSVTVTHFAVSTGEQSSDDYAAVEIPLSISFPFSFKVSKIEMFYQKVISAFSNSEQTVGHEPFDKVFKVEASNLTSLVELLHVEMPDAESNSLLNDLMLAHKKYHRVIFTDKSITLGVRADLGDSHRIEPAINKAIYLAERIETAGRKMSEGNRKI